MFGVEPPMPLDWPRSEISIPKKKRSLRGRKRKSEKEIQNDASTSDDDCRNPYLMQTEDVVILDDDSVDAGSVENTCCSCPTSDKDGIEYPPSPGSDVYRSIYEADMIEIQKILEEKKRLNDAKGSVEEHGDNDNDADDDTEEHGSMQEDVSDYCIDPKFPIDEAIAWQWQVDDNGYLFDLEENLSDVSKYTDEELVRGCHIFKPDKDEVKVLRKYLQDLYDSKGFHFSGSSASFYPLTNIFPRQSVIEEGKKSKEFQEIMSLTKLAIRKYNKEKNKNFKVRRLDKLNMSFGGYSTYYVTFTVEDLNSNGSKESFIAKLVSDNGSSRRGVVFCRPNPYY